MNFINTMDTIGQKIRLASGSLRLHKLKAKKLGQRFFIGHTNDGKSLVIRRYCDIRDEPQKLFDLHLRAFASLSQFTAPNTMWGSDLLAPKDNYMHGRQDLVVAYVGKELAGIGALIESDTLCTEFVRLRVDPKFHNHGVGAKLKQVREFLAKEEYGYLYALMETSDYQQASVHLAEKAGYQKMLEIEEPWYACPDKNVKTYYHLKKLK